jgi:ABC-type polysaccharide/polyol phosphate transport system ATPase subunit
MSSSPATAPDLAVSLRDVSKIYTIWNDPMERLTHVLRQSIGIGRPAAVKRFHAVRHISLEIAPGECLGIIGRNGAGKSTLLQMIAGTVQPSEGSVTVRGRVAALLELGSGFNPDFSGRENILMNAAILGLDQATIAARYDSIVEYSGIGEFIEQPVRTYSSGMTLRLAFAVCVHVDADIFIIDEALAVGDARFQFKCHATLEQMLQEGRTIIFVSHDTNAVKRMCRTAVLLERGEVLLKGSPNDVTNIYTKLITSPHGLESIREDLAAIQQSGGDRGPEAENPQSGSDIPETGALKIEATAPGLPAPSPAADLLSPSLSTENPGTRLLAEERTHQQISDKEYSYGGETGQITSVVLNDLSGSPRLSFVTGSYIQVRITCEARQAVTAPIYALTLKDVRGQEIYGTNTYFQNQNPPDVPAGGRAEVTFTLPLNILPGVFFISLGWVQLVNGEVEVIHRRYDVLRFDVMPRDKSFGLAWCPATIQVGAPAPVRTDEPAP